jgi:hypothetical protein
MVQVGNSGELIDREKTVSLDVKEAKDKMPC